LENLRPCPQLLHHFVDEAGIMLSMKRSSSPSPARWGATSGCCKGRRRSLQCIHCWLWYLQSRK